MTKKCGGDLHKNGGVLKNSKAEAEREVNNRNLKQCEKRENGERIKCTYLSVNKEKTQEDAPRKKRKRKIKCK